ncbi:MAG: hypothetical protein OHK0031_06030 [Anaerolineales bacterium]
MNILHYFDLGLMPQEAMLGKKTPAEEQKSALKRFGVTLLMYAFVWLGILGQKILALQQAGTPVSWQNLGDGFILTAFVIATALFPTVFPKVFVKMPAKQSKAGAGGWFFVQLCVAFQQGFFWQALLSLMMPK